MALRFRKSIKIAPGVRMNIGKRGLTSVSVGKTNFGKRGVHQNFSIPGTGISYQATIIGRSGANSGRSGASGQRVTHKTPTPIQAKSTSSVKVRLTLAEDGSLVMRDDKGRLLSADQVQSVKKQQREVILQWLQEQADAYNHEIEDLIKIHFTTPSPSGEIVINPRPQEPALTQAGLASKFVGKLRERADEKNKLAQLQYEEALRQWSQIEHALRADAEFMSNVLANAFSTLEWPRETNVSFEIRNDGTLVIMDIDLPEIEDMPTEIAGVNQTQLKLNIKQQTEKAVKLEYLAHIFGIGFRFIGDVFAHLPSVTTVVLSGFSQRISKSTARMTDEYLYSVRVTRDQWNRIDFRNLEALDIVKCFEPFELRKKISANGQITPIEPYNS